VTGTVHRSSGTQLVVLTEPGGGTGGLAWAQQPVVEIHDAGGQIDAAYDGPVTAQITAATGTSGAALMGTPTVNAVGGVATFTDLAINLAGTGYTLTFMSGPLMPAVSAPFDITVGPAAGLHIGTHPGGASMGVVFAVQPVLHVVDAGGNVITTDNTTVVKASITTSTGASGAMLAGTTLVTAAGGTVTFTDLQIDLQGVGYTLDFSANGFTVVVSEPFGVAGPPAQLGIAVQPNGALPNTPFVVQPEIEIQDSLGTVVVTDNTTQVTATLVAGTGLLSGTLTVTASNGVATFTNLQLDMVGTGFEIEFTSTPPLTPVVSDPFGVAGPATQLGIRTQPGDARAGKPFGQQPVIEIQDANGTWVPTDNTTVVFVSLVSGSGNGNANGNGQVNGKGNGKGNSNGKGNGHAVGHRRGVLSGTLSATAVDGVVTFTDLSIDWPGMYRLRFEDTSNTLDPVVSDRFRVGGPAVKPAGCAAAVGTGEWIAIRAFLIALGAVGASVRLHEKHNVR
jgi:hypothetical protein